MVEVWQWIALGGTAGFLAGQYVGGWLEARMWRIYAKGITRKESGGKLYRVTEEP